MATTALSATQPKCLPRSAQALAPAADANITAVVATIQCRAGSDAVHGAAINSTPPPIHATVPACHTARIRVRIRGGSMVALRNTAAADRASDFSSIRYCMVLRPALAAVNTVVYGKVSQG